MTVSYEVRSQRARMNKSQGDSTLAVKWKYFNAGQEKCFLPMKLQYFVELKGAIFQFTETRNTTLRKGLSSGWYSTGN